MGFKSLIQNQVKGAMRILGTDADGLARAGTYHSVSETTTYDPITATVTQVSTPYTDVPMVLVRFNLDDMDESVRPKTDRKALIAALDLAVTPTPQDRVETATGEVYSVQRLLSDPADALHILHIRRES